MTPHRTIDLNADVGEATDAAGVEVERTLLGLVTSVHVACGGHAGDDDSMKATVAAALEHARPGRRPSLLPRPRRLRPPADGDRPRRARCVVVRAGGARSIASAGRPARPSRSVKAHGALYEEVAKGGAVYETFRDAVRASVGEDVALVLPSGCRAMAMVLRDGMTAREEGFCDRAYRPDGGLVDRSEAGRRAHRPRGGGGAGAQPGPRRGGRRRRLGADLWVDTLCIHGDSPGAVAIATAVRTAMAEVGIKVVAPARA